MTVEKVLLFCYHYDPATGSYVLFATNFMRAGGILTVLIIALFLWRMFRNERRNRQKPLAPVVAGMPPPREGLV